MILRKMSMLYVPYVDLRYDALSKANAFGKYSLTSISTPTTAQSSQ